MLQFSETNPPTYGIYSDDGPNPNSRYWLFSPSLVETLGNLRTIRNNIYNPSLSNTEGPSAFVAETNEDYPYSNKIGPLREDDSNHLGYRFVCHEKKVKTLEGKDGKRKMGVSTLKEDLEKPVMAAKGEANGIGYQRVLVVLWSWSLSYGLAL
jgi:hypothetical protein